MHENSPFRPGARPEYYIWGGLSPRHRERGSTSLYWGLGQSPQWGSRGHCSRWGSGAKPP